jgi:hypothetical protein
MLWFSGQQVDVLRHHHIPLDAEIEAASDALQRSLERLPACVRHEQRTTMIATERNEVALFRFLKSFQTPRHEVSLRPATSPLKPKQGLSGPPDHSRAGQSATAIPQGEMRIAVGTHIAMRPPHKTGRAAFPHPAPTSGV